MVDPVVVLQEMPATNNNVVNEEHTNSKKTWGSYNNLMKKLRSRVHTPLHLDQHPSRASFSSSASEEEEILKASSYHGQTDGRIVNNNGSLPPVSSFISEQHGPVMMKKSSSTEDRELKSLRCMMATMDGLTSSTSTSRKEERRKLHTTTKSLSCSNFGNGQCHSLGRNTNSHGSNHNAQHGSLPPVSSFISEQRGPAMMKSTPDNELQSVRRMMATLDGLL